MEKIFFEDSKGNRLVGILSNPSGRKNRPVIILCHGLTTNKNNSTNTVLTKVLAEHDISTLRFDFFGHGESEGKFENITISEAVDGILSATNYLKKKGYEIIGLVGSSFGGISSLLAASETKDLCLLALKSPVSDYPEVQAVKMGLDGIRQWKEEGYTIHKNSKGEERRLNYTFYEDSEKNKVHDIAGNIKIPTLIVHGDNDESVPVEQSRKTASLIENCKLEVIHGADHRYSKQSDFERMIQLITEFILDHV